MGLGTLWVKVHSSLQVLGKAQEKGTSQMWPRQGQAQEGTHLLLHQVQRQGRAVWQGG